MPAHGTSHQRAAANPEQLGAHRRPGVDRQQGEHLPAAAAHQRAVDVEGQHREDDDGDPEGHLLHDGSPPGGRNVEHAEEGGPDQGDQHRRRDERYREAAPGRDPPLGSRAVAGLLERCVDVRIADHATG